MRVLIASHNLGKQREIKSLLTGVGVELVMPHQLSNLDNLQVDETGSSICENALLKASAFAAKSKLNCLADDSSLEIAALDNLPGVHAKRFFPGSGSDRNQEILRRMTGIADRRAKFSACLCLVSPDQPPQYFKGEVMGTIALQEQGDGGFDYDRIFIPRGQQLTFAQLGMTAKNELSHRYQALSKLKAYLRVDA